MRLVIKDFGTTTLYKGQTAQEMIGDYQARPNAPEIHYLDEQLTSEQLAGLYRRSDVLVAPYRGEGFSLPTLEAMACGTPAIVTRGGATDDFVDAETAWQIPSRQVSVGRAVYGEDLGCEGFLLEPQARELAEALKHVTRARDEVREKGRHAAERASEWSWERATLEVLRRIDALCGTQTANAAEQRLAGQRESA